MRKNSESVINYGAAENFFLSAKLKRGKLFYYRFSVNEVNL